MTAKAKAAEGPDESAALAELQQKVERCRACPRLVAWREQVAAEPRAAFKGERYWARPLFGFGDPSARLVLVGLAPAAHGGNRTGRMFTGDRSGEFLFGALYRAGYANRAQSVARDDGLSLSGCYVTAAVRCAPPENRPLPDERARCASFLQQELELLVNRRVILVLGAFALNALLALPDVALDASTRRAKFAHGAEFELRGRDDRPCTLLCSYHPSQRNVFTGLLTPQMFDAVLARAKALSSS